MSRPHIAELRALAPRGNRRMGCNPHANGGLLLHELRMPDFRKYAVPVSAPGAETAEATRALGKMLRDILKLNPGNFRVFGPDETSSNRLDAVFEATNAGLAAYWQAIFPGEVPEQPVLPDRFEDTSIGLEGTVLDVIDIGQGDTEHSTILHVPSIAAVVGGDVVYNQVHMMTAETDDRSREDWIAALDAMMLAPIEMIPWRASWLR